MAALLTVAFFSMVPAAWAQGARIVAPSLLAKADAAKKAPAAVKGAAVKPEKQAKAPKAAKAPKKAKAPRAKRVPHVHDPAAGPWDQGALWVTARGGYNRAGYRTAADGNAGYGFGFTKMYNPAWSLSGVAERDVLGKFADASEIEMPFTLELDRHLNWNANFRPFIGFGGGTYYHKFSGTTADYSDVRWGALFSCGGNVVVAPHSMIGLDARFATVSTRGESHQATNPVFGIQERTTSRFSLKATWSVTY